MKDRFIAALKERPYWNADCSLCGYSMHFRIIHDRLEYDSGCLCTNTTPNWEERPMDELDFYLEPEHGHLDKIMEFIESVEGEENEHLSGILYH